MDDHHRHNLGLNKLSKSIRKSPLHQPNFPLQQTQHQQPRVYNISKSDFRSVVQQLTGSPSRDAAQPVCYPPPPPKPPSSRLMRIRPPPLNPIAPPRPPPPSAWAESPVSAYMRYLESSLLMSDSSRQTQPLQPALLPSPNSQFLLQSPSSFLNLVSPKSPYQLLSPPPPRFQYPAAILTPNFSGILGPGPEFQPLPSPGFLFPPSPSGSLPFLSPRWREM